MLSRIDQILYNFRFYLSCKILFGLRKAATNSMNRRVREMSFAILSQHFLMGVYVIYNPSIILRNGIAAIGRQGITGVGDCKQPIGGSLSTPIYEEEEEEKKEEKIATDLEVTVMATR